MKWISVGAALIAVIVAAIFWYSSDTGAPELVGQLQDEGIRSAVPDELSQRASSPFQTTEPDEIADPATPVIFDTPPAAPSNYAIPSQASVSWDGPLSEEQFQLLLEQLKNDPARLQQLIDEFRQETDLQRKKQLAKLLGDVGGEQITLLASELIFSGDSDARTVGMRLLQDLQPDSPQARDIVSNMLATEVDPQVLVETMTALAKPGDVDQQSRAYLSDQVAWLTTHQDDGVRSISLDILSRWSDDGRYTDVLLSGLDDSSKYVRASAVYALVGHEDSSPVVIERLLLTLRTSEETKRVKRAAILALRSMPITQNQANEIDTLERQLNTVTRR